LVYHGHKPRARGFLPDLKESLPRSSNFNMPVILTDGEDSIPHIGTIRSAFSIGLALL
jgi:hypothetical protein